MKKFLCLILVLLTMFSLVSVASEDETDKKVYLTFDDGPTPNTAKILDTLKKYNAKATFFVLEDRIRQHPDIMARIISEGHKIGLHGVSHDVNTIYSSPSEPLLEMNKANETLYNTLGFKTTLIRTPYGSYPYMSLEQYRILCGANYKIWDWTVDPRDSVGTAPSASSLLERIKRDLKGNEFPIVLLHDRKSTSNNLEYILSFFSGEGYKYAVLDESMDSVNFMILYGPAKDKSS